MDKASKFSRHSPGGEAGAILALSLFDDLLGLLREKGVLTPDEITSLFVSAAHRLGQSPNAHAKRGARFIKDAIIPEQNLD